MLPYSLPPAESRLPLKSILRGFSSTQPDFADELKKILKVQQCLLANSARSLLFLVLKNISETSRPGQNQVLIPGYTCYSVPAATVKAGLKVALYDLEPDTLQPDMADLEKKITSKTLAVVGQHLLGVHSDMTKIAALAREKHAWTIEDSAQVLGEKRPAHKNGAEADFTLYSFGRGKPLPLGSGGALISKNGLDLESIIPQMHKLPGQNGKSLMPAAVQVLSRPSLYWFLEKLPLGLGQTIYDPGFKIHGMSVAYQRIGGSAALELNRLNMHRFLIAKIYNKAFSSDMDLKVKGPVVPHVRYPLLVDQREKADSLARYGVRKLYPKALCDLDELKPELADPNVRTPGAREISRRLITLPTHLGVSEPLARKISTQVKKTFSRQISTISA